MEKQVLAAASFETQKYFFSPEFLGVPEEIQEEIRMVCVLTAEKLKCSFIIGFEENGTVYFETVRPEDEFNFDEIGAELEIKQLQRTKRELWKALQLWYVVFCTEEGKDMAKEILSKQK
ncbi:MAG: hypothetical protein GX299_05455 [Epulopiscium sp.]|jgi:hypothetical protein|nr:hypothetical protein [Candidatus Epulonipiscium sp.]